MVFRQEFNHHVFAASAPKAGAEIRELAMIGHIEMDEDSHARGALDGIMVPTNVAHGRPRHGSSIIDRHRILKHHWIGGSETNDCASLSSMAFASACCSGVQILKSSENLLRRFSTTRLRSLRPVSVRWG